MSLLDDLLPIRRIFYAAVEQVFVRDLEFDALGFTFTVDTTNRKATLSLSGSTPLDSASFGTAEDHRVKSYTVAATSAAASIMTAASFTVPDNTGCDFVITILVRKDGTNDMYRQDHRVTYSRNGAGAPAIQGSLVNGTAVATGALAGTTSTIDVSGNDVRVRLTPSIANACSISTIIQVQQAA